MQDVQLNPMYVYIEDDKPGSVVCKVMNTASLPFTWNGFKWYDPKGNQLERFNSWWVLLAESKIASRSHQILYFDDCRAIVDTVYHTPTATAGDFWTSTLYVDSKDYTINGQYICEVNYNGEVTRRQAMVDVKGQEVILFDLI